MTWQIEDKVIWNQLSTKIVGLYKPDIIQQLNDPRVLILVPNGVAIKSLSYIESCDVPSKYLDKKAYMVWTSSLALIDKCKWCECEL